MARAKFRDVILDRYGNVQSSSVITVYEPGTTTLIPQTIYNAPTGVGTYSNPFTIGSDGLVEFWLDKGKLIDLKVQSPGMSDQTVRTVPAIPDPTRIRQYAILSSSTTVSNTTSETTFSKAVTLEAGELNVAGAVITMRLAGRFGTPGASPATFRIKGRVGGTPIGDFTAAPAISQTSQGWSAIFSATVRTSGAAGDVQAGMGFGGFTSDTMKPNILQNTPTLDLTSALTVDVTVTMSIADAANLAQLKTMVVEIRDGATVA